MLNIEGIISIDLTALYRKKKMGQFRKIIFLIALALIYITLIGCGESRQQKTEAILNNLNILETYETTFKSQIELFKEQSTGRDSVRVIELEKR